MIGKKIFLFVLDSHGWRWWYSILVPSGTRDHSSPRLAQGAEREERLESDDWRMEKTKQGPAQITVVRPT